MKIRFSKSSTTEIQRLNNIAEGILEYKDELLSLFKIIRFIKQSKEKTNELLRWCFYNG